MKRSRVLLLWTLGLALAGAGVSSTRYALRDRMPPAVVRGRAPGPGQPTLTVSASHLDSAWMSAPFRASRTVPPRRYTPQAAAAAAAAADSAKAADAAARAAADSAAAAAEQRPQWKLTGTLLGSPPVAIFDGAAGSADGGGVLTLGEEVDGFTVSQIYADSVIVTRGGRAWTYVVDLPWS